MANRKVVVEFLGKDTSLSRTAKQAGDNTSRLGDRMRTAGKVGAVALVAGTALVAKGLYSAGKAAAQDEQQQKLLATAMKNSAGASKGQVAATEKWISAQGRALGVTDDKLRPSMQTLVRATGDVGEAQKLASLGMDISAGTGKDLETVSLALAKAQNGNVGALGRLGIATKNADGSTKSFAEIQKDLSSHFGGAAASKANTFQGKMDRLKLVMDETKEAIGARLLPVVTKLATWFLNKALPAISKFSNWMKANVAPVFEKVKNAISGLLNGSGGDFSKAFANIISIVKNAISIIQSLWRIFGGTLTTFVKAAWGNIKQIIGGALNVIAGIFKVISSVLKGDWKGAWDGIKQIVKGAWTMIKGIINAGWNIVKGVFKLAGNALKAIFGGIWKGLKSLASKGIGQIVSVVKSIPGKLKALGGKFKDAGVSLIKSLFNGLKNAGSSVASLAGAVWKAVKSKFNSLISAMNRAIPNRIGFINLPDNPIPRLAKGGIVKAKPGGTLALLGEAGQDEAVIPIGRRTGSRPAAAAAGAAGQDMRPIIVQLVVDGKVLHQSLVKRKRDTGMALGLA